MAFEVLVAASKFYHCVVTLQVGLIPNRLATSKSRKKISQDATKLCYINLLNIFGFVWTLYLYWMDTIVDRNVVME